MKCLVTGAAGFIGSHISEKLIELGHNVIAIDCFTDYYPRTIKESNIVGLRKNGRCTFIDENLLKVDLNKLLKGIDIIFHQAAQAGVRASWGKDFNIYIDNNILATQMLLEAARKSKIKKLIYASSSSVYGDIKDIPMREDSPTLPISPYGTTKLAAEHLCQLYHKNFGIPAVSLRYFTVYGPRQRPDMAFNKFIKAMLSDKEIAIYGDGKQTRDFTYISDAVDANIAAMESKETGKTFNIGGGSRVSVNKVIEILENIIGEKARTAYTEKQKGDMKDTVADISRAQKLLGYKPKVKLEEGLKKEVEWLKIHQQT